MSEQGYPIVVTKLSEEEGGGYLAFAPDLPGCMTDAETPEAAVQGIQSAIGEWLDESERMGRAAPEPGSAAEKVQHDHEAARQERRQLYDTLKSQANVIKKQERLLKEARKEVERVQAATDALIETESSSDEVILGGVWVVPTALVGSYALGKRKQRLLS